MRQTMTPVTKAKSRIVGEMEKRLFMPKGVLHVCRCWLLSTILNVILPPNVNLLVVHLVIYREAQQLWLTCTILKNRTIDKAAAGNGKQAQQMLCYVHTFLFYPSLCVKWINQYFKKIDKLYEGRNGSSTAWITMGHGLSVSCLETWKLLSFAMFYVYFVG